MRYSAKMSLRDVAARYPTDFLKFHAGIQKLVELTKEPPPVERNLSVTVLWGPTGVGKSHRLRRQYPGGYTIRAGRGPFDNYQNEEVVIFEEFSDADWPISEMLMLLDKWPCPLNCRYQNKSAYWNKVFIVSNLNPSSFYRNEDQPRRDAFFRRIHNIHYVENQQQNIDL